MTIEEARKLLGLEVENISDEQLQKEIDTADLLKNIHFDLSTKEK